MSCKLKTEHKNRPYESYTHKGFKLNYRKVHIDHTILLQACLEVESPRIVLAHAPKDSHSFKNSAHGLGKTTNKFTFSRIFQEEVSQKELFNEAMLSLVKDFIDGQNCLVFTYGVTSSGKTYTVQGIKEIVWSFC